MMREKKTKSLTQSHYVSMNRCLSCCRTKDYAVEIVKDNCCHCNYAALKKMLTVGEVSLIQS